MTKPLISFRNISKSFGANQANRAVSFDVFEGCIHGIVGENGAGKSTIMKILFGLESADSGEILLRNIPVAFSSPKQAIAHQIGMVHQHFMLAPGLSGWENIILGSEPASFVLKQEAVLSNLKELQNEFGSKLDLTQAVETFSLGEQQQTEILKALYRKSTLLILDEPTAVLSPQETEHLFNRLLKLKQNGTTIIIITHKLKDILKFTDWVTVMRQGTVVSTQRTSQTNETLLSEQMMGKNTVQASSDVFSPGQEVAFEVRNLSTSHQTKLNLLQCNFHIQAGEILGLAGIEGSGQELLVEAISQLCPYSGDILLKKKPMDSGSLYSLRQNGFGLIPPDRQRDGLVLEFSVGENLVLGHHRENNLQVRWGLNALRELDVRPLNLDVPVSGLSGGNQQKLLLARETQQELTFLIACHPTRGVDVGAARSIHARLKQLAQQGTAILLVSSDLDELFALSHRIMVMREGAIVLESNPQSLSLASLGLWMTGVKQ